ncbi:MAG: hypothetical protein M1832_002110 [Thelocarpon impressellum]|nr:MAG: hypothetical protein M1832_002110 [Thelocarpon impressellum]
MPRLVRRQPLADRIKAYLNPWDFLLWLSEEVDSNDWDEFQRSYATPLGLVCNLVFLIARSNSGASASFVVHLLSLLSVVNAVYTFYRKRHYRLFETPVDAPPNTPSASRVNVASSPLSSSPLRFLSKIIAASTAESRSYPDSRRDVWEVAVWDPVPLSLRLFCLFSPGHVLVYWLFLPAASHDPRPSTTVLTAVVMGALLSAQMMILQSNYSQQTKDTAVIHKEVLHEYDVKYVHPRTTVPVRDVGTQYGARDGAPTNSVDTYTPTTIVNKGFKTNPNPNYADHINPHGAQLRTPRAVPGSKYMSFQTPRIVDGLATPLRKTPFRQPQFRASQGGDGGSLGVYTHANSPLKKSVSTNFPARAQARPGRVFA